MLNPQQSDLLQSVLTINVNGNEQLFRDDSSLFENSDKSMAVVVHSTDPISSIFEIIGVSSSQYRLIYKKQVLCPALSFAFYYIQDNDVITISEVRSSPKVSKSESTLTNLTLNNHENLLTESSDKTRMNRHFPLHRFSSDNTFKNVQRSYSQKSNDRLNRFINEKRLYEEDSQNLQRFQDSLNPITASEFARFTDIYRSRIESNTKSFRKLCAKYNALANSDSSFSYSKKMISSQSLHQLEHLSKDASKCKNISASMETVLPEKPSLPSTDLLPTFTSVNHF